MKLSEIAARVACDLESADDLDISGIAGIDDAGPGELTFVSNRKYIRHLSRTRASAVILGHDMPAVDLPTLRSSNPYLAFAKALELFYAPPRPGSGIHPTAVIAPGVEIGEGASIGPYVVIDQGCRLGKRVTLHAHVVLYPGVTLGDDATLHSHAVIREFCRIGDRSVIQNGAVIGGDGFGFAPRGDGTYHKILQSGNVLLGSDVEVGANSTLDRAAVGCTRIGNGTKLDNLVQVGHGCRVGENSVIAAQVGLAGSSLLGNDVKLGGQVGIAGHLEIGDGAVVTAQSGTSHDVPAGAVVSGSPAFENALWRRAVVAFGRLPDLLRRVRVLEERIDRIGPP